MKNFLSFFIFLFLSFSFNANARFATFEEAPSKVLFSNKDILIERTGKYKTIHEKSIKILNETGRKNHAITTINYTKNISHIHIIEAYTDNNGEISKIDPTSIITKTLGDAPKDLDQKYQIQIFFPKVVVGSTLYLKYEEYVHTPPLNKEYFDSFFYGYNEYIEKSHVKITCRIPEVRIKSRDPSNALQIKEVRKGDSTYIDVTLTKPLYFQLINEPFSEINYNNLSFFYLTTFKTSTDLVSHLYPKYDEVISEELPPIFNEIYESSKSVAKEYDQLNFISSAIADKITYIDGWYTVKGKYFPRSLKEISDTGYADCKEYASVLSAILRKLGYQANPTFIYKGIGVRAPLELLPSITTYNHAVVNVKTPKGIPLWVDPTKFTSFSRAAYPDITARTSLIITSTMNIPSTVTYPDPSEFRVIKNFEITFKDNIANVKGDIQYKRLAAEFLTGLELKTSKLDVKEFVKKEISGEMLTNFKYLNIPPLNSRMVKDIKIEYEFSKIADIINTNMGKAYLISSFNENWMKYLTTASNENKGIIYPGTPYIITQRIVLKNFNAENTRNLNYKFVNSWFAVSRKVTKEGNDLIIDEEIEYRKVCAFEDDISKEKMEKYNSQIKQNIQNTLIIGTPIEDNPEGSETKK
jgi:hypothetical protein